jgi:hypothetical protein
MYVGAKWSLATMSQIQARACDEGRQLRRPMLHFIRRRGSASSTYNT